MGFYKMNDFIEKLRAPNDDESDDFDLSVTQTPDLDAQAQMNLSVDDLLSNYSIRARANAGADGEKDIDEENMFAENDIENSIQQNAASGVAAGVGALASINGAAQASCLIPEASSFYLPSSAENKQQLLKELNLDNEEALKQIKNQLCEIKMSTSKAAAGAGVSGAGQLNENKQSEAVSLNAKSVLSSADDEESMMPKTSRPTISLVNPNSKLNKYKGWWNDVYF